MLFKDRRKLRALIGALTSLLLFLVVFVSGPVMSLENSDSAKNLVPTILKNPEVKTSLANKILDQITDGSNGLISLSIKAKRAEFVTAISNALSSPATIAEIQKDVGIAYEFVTSDQPSITLEIKPLIKSLISAMGSVDPLFLIANMVLKDVKPITLTRDASTPQFGTWLSVGQDIYVVLIILLILCLFLFVRFSASTKRALRAVGIRVLVVGMLAIAQFIALAVIASKIANNATDPTAKAVIPVAARALFSYYQSIGIALVLVGAVAVFIASRLKAPTNQNELALESAYAPM